MATSKHMERICVIAVILALVITILFCNGAWLGIEAVKSQLGYESLLFRTDTVHTIDIVMEDWEGFLATCSNEEYAMCNVVIDGESYPNVAIRGKGNTSLSTVASMGSDRYSFKIEFDHYDSSKTYHGLDKLSLNNLIQDNTMMKDYLTYQMMNAFGVAAPLSSFVSIRVNGEPWGLYLAVEAVEESFLLRNYGADYGELYKPDSMNLGGGRGNGKDFRPDDLATEEDTTARRGNMDGGMGTDDVRLQYINDDLSSYGNIFVSAKTDVTEADQQRLVKSLRALSGQQHLDAVLDMEAVLRYFVVHNYVVNGDSYTGSMIHNYYLYEKDGQMSMIPWDYNLAFGTFQASNAAQAVNDDIDAPLSVTGEGRPMVDWIYSDSEYTAWYHTLFGEFLDAVDPVAIIDNAYGLISDYVASDPTKFCTTEQFLQGVATLRSFCALRSESVAAQLFGQTQPVDASGINLSDMGTMSRSSASSGTMEKPEDMGGMQPPGGMENPGGMQPPEGMENPGGMQPPEGMENPGQLFPTDGTFPSEGGQFPGGMGQMQRPEGMEGMQRPGNTDTAAPSAPQGGIPQGGAEWIMLGICILVLLFGLIFAYKFKR